MYFTHLRLKNFGPFVDARYDFERERINWISGPNASGKTQLAGAILSALVGRPALSIDKTGAGPTEVEVTIEDEHTQAQERVKLTVSIDHDERVQVESTSSPLALTMLAALSDAHEQRLMVDVRFEALRNVPKVEEIERHLPASLSQRPEWQDLRDGIAGGTLSRGQQGLVVLVLQLVDRVVAPVKLPLLIEGWESTWWDTRVKEFALAVLEEVLMLTQVIALTTDVHGPTTVSHSAILSGHSATNPLAWFDNGFVERRPNLRRKPATRWTLGSKLRPQESRTCEYKEVKGAHALESIKSTVDQYVVAFMNAGVAQEGAIYWGVRDADHEITGVHLSPQQCDELRRVVTERLHQIVPPIAPTAYRVELHALTDGGKLLPDMYVVEVRVPSVRRTLLFATGRHEVYVKTDAGKRKLTVLELQQELVKRLGVDPDF